MTATSPTRNNQDWRRSAQAAAVAQAQAPLARVISEQRAESAAVWTRNYLSNNSFAIDPSAFPDGDATGEQHDAMAQAAPSNVTNVSLPHGRDGDENLFSTEQTERVGGTQDTEAVDPRSSSLLRRGAPRPDDGLARESVAPNRPRPRRAPEASGAPLRRITITNDTESRDVQDRRRANHRGLQTALYALDVSDFASLADVLAWEQEWKRQSRARAPQRPQNERAAE
jgi:hypothetical protein